MRALQCMRLRPDSVYMAAFDELHDEGTPQAESSKAPGAEVE